MSPKGPQVLVGISSIDTRQKQAATCQHFSFSCVTILGISELKSPNITAHFPFQLYPSYIFCFNGRSDIWTLTCDKQRQNSVNKYSFEKHWHGFLEIFLFLAWQFKGISELKPQNLTQHFLLQFYLNYYFCFGWRSLNAHKHVKNNVKMP